MAAATVRFYGALTDFLPPERRSAPLLARFDGEPAVRDVIESLGVPHVEVELLLIDGVPSAFSARVRDGARVAAYPAFSGIEVPEPLLATPRLDGEPRFVLDGHLGTLARNLRLLGFDARYSSDAADEELAQLAASERRVLLSRDVGLLKRRVVVHGYFPRHTDPRAQLAEVVQRFSLPDRARPFTRCMRCNGALLPVAKAEIERQLPPRTRMQHSEFKRCEGCGRIYWAGSHHQKLLALTREVLEAKAR